MTRDEIINGLEREVKSIRKEPQGKMLGIFMTVDEAEDIITLLKDQETEDIGRGRLLFLCKTCGFGYDDIFVNDESKYSLVPRYCPNCGRLVKRDA